MLLLGIDLETGANFKTELKDNFITEIGIVVWDTDYNQPVKTYSEFILNDKEITDEATQYTGITKGMLSKYGVTLDSISSFVHHMFKKVDYIIAHNGLAFDKPLLENFMHLPNKTWIDTMIDVPYPSNCMSKNLTYLAGFHGFCNPFPHRAVTDVMAMFKVLMNYDIEKVIESAKSPIVKAVWSSKYPKQNCSNYFNLMKEFNFKKDLAKSHGFIYDAISKQWELKTRKCLLPKIELNYKLELVK